MAKALPIIGLIFFAALALAAPVPNSEKNIVGLAASTPDLSTLVTALKAGNLVTALSGVGPFTVFAPTNEAFAKLPLLLLRELLDPKNIAQLDTILKYHVIAGAAVYAADLKNGTQHVKTLEGNQLLITKIPLFDQGSSLTVQKATVIIADVRASNGVVHIIDGVLSPPDMTIVELAAASVSLTTLVTALKAGRLAAALSAPGPFTVFAPTNEAFAKLPKATLASLIEPKNIAQLDDILKYHVIAGTAVYAEDLKASQDVKTLDGKQLRITKSGPFVTVQKAHVITADVIASNGVVHIIDGVLTPPGAKPVEKNICKVIAAIPDLSDLVTATTALEFNALCDFANQTLFAPSNAAWSKLPAGTLAHLLEPASVYELSWILEYHVAVGTFFSKDLQNGQKITGGSQNDVPLRVTVDDGSVLIDDAKVIRADISASNGVVHIIDTVLTERGPYPVPSIWEQLESIVFFGEISTFATALKAAKLKNVLSTTGPFTVFAPTNDAFAKLPKATLTSLLQPENIDKLQNILSIHIVAGVNLRAGVCGPNKQSAKCVSGRDLEGQLAVQTLQGDNVYIFSSLIPGKIFLSPVDSSPNVTRGQYATITTTLEKNLRASNGIVHTIDTVLIPVNNPHPDKNIVQLAASTPALATLVTALKAGNLVTALSGPGPFTVFAPTNEAFAALPSASLVALLEPKNIKELQDILKYHVIAGAAVYVKDLKKGSQDVTTLEGKQLEIYKYAFNDAVYLEHQTSNVLTADIGATNGVVHIIGTVLSVPTGTKNICEVIAAIPDLSDLVLGTTALEYNALCGGQHQTLFAPSNAAWAKLPAGTLAHLLEPASIYELSWLLEYHVVDSKALFSKDLKNGHYITEEYGPQHDFPLRVTVDGSKILIADATVITADIGASNGVVHIIDTVLTGRGPYPTSSLLKEISFSQFGELSTFGMALKAAQLDNVFIGPLSASKPGEVPHSPFTVFAPTNDAFAKLPKATLTSLLQPENIDKLQNILSIHIVAGVNLRAGVCVASTFHGKCVSGRDLEAEAAVQTVHGDNVYIRSGDDGTGSVSTSLSAGDTFSGNDFATIKVDSSQNLRCSNGILHYIDTVLIPVNYGETLFSALSKGQADFTTFVAALKAGVLVDKLNTCRHPLEFGDCARLPAANPSLTKGEKGLYTVFVPTNEAFARLGKTTLAELLDPRNIGRLQAVLEYHIVPDFALRAGCGRINRPCNLRDIEGQPNGLKTLQGSSIQVTTSGGDVFVDRSRIRPRDTFDGQIGALDQPALDNGNFFVIDSVLIPLN